LLFTPLGCALHSDAQEKPVFPSDTEIRLLVTQAERAVQQYKLLLDEEAVQLGKNGSFAMIPPGPLQKAGATFRSVGFASKMLALPGGEHGLN